MDVYTMVTDRIIAQLEQGYIPWKKPWASCLDGTFNRISRRPYSLLNQMLLEKEGEYATLRQWNLVGGRVKKGSKAEFVVFWKMREVKEIGDDGENRIRQIPILRYYTVFHISDVENVFPIERTKDFKTEPIETAEKILKDYIDREHITLSVGESDRAFYCPEDDSITLPAITQFKHAEAYYSTAFHECGHSTLKKSRCDREDENALAFWGTENYSKEELVAEITSSSLLNYIGIETKDTFMNTAAYIQNWLRVLRNDKKFVVSASGKAEKAVRYILGLNYE